MGNMAAVMKKQNAKVFRLNDAIVNKELAALMEDARSKTWSTTHR